MTRRFIAVALVVAAGLAHALAGQAPAPTPDTSLHTHLVRASRTAAHYLAAACNADGQFVYRVNTNPNVRVAARYNIVRHAGAIYALADYQARHPDPTLDKTLIRAVAFLKRTALHPLPAYPELATLWSYPEQHGRTGSPEAKLGAAGLGLAALVQHRALHPDATSLTTLRHIGRFTLFMQKPNGSFYSKYFVTASGRSDKWTSLYYPGEAALGLLMLHEADPRHEWLNGAAKAIAYLANSRQGSQEVPIDHWALIATARLLPLYAKHTIPVPRKRVIAHAVQIVNTILANAAQHPADSPLHGCMTTDGRTTPTATQLEGLLTALTFLPPEHHALAQRIHTRVTPAIRFLLRAQIRTGLYAGGVPRAIAPLPHNHPKHSRSFNNRSTEIRIDYVQHALSAWLLYQQLPPAPKPH